LAFLGVFSLKYTHRKRGRGQGSCHLSLVWSPRFLIFHLVWLASTL